MLFFENFVIFLIYITSLSYALQCTTNCFFTLNFNDRFEIPDNCNQTVSAGQCQISITIPYEYNYYMFSFSALSSSYLLSDNHFAMIKLLDDDSIMFMYSINHACKNKDDCAREFAINNMFDIRNRPAINYQDIRNELLPLLSSNLSVENFDLPCFDSNENVRQCAIATKPGACRATNQLIGRKTTNRSCENEFSTSPQGVTIYDSNKFATFSIKCNRSLCNGPLTLKAVKEIMFKYNVTKTIEGRLINHGLYLSLSSTFLMLIITFLLFNRFFLKYN